MPGKKRRFTSQYNGPLTASEVAAGINAASRHAHRLHQDAEHLLGSDAFASAFALACLSIEETGKVGILKSIGMATDADELRKFWREYRSHKSKNSLWIVPDFILGGARKLDDFAGVFDADQDHHQVLDELKQLAFYTECIRSTKWSEPPKTINEELARSLVKIAGVFATNREVTVEELEVHFKHIGPVRNTTVTQIEQAHIDSYTEMQARGIKATGPNEAADLIHGRIGPPVE